MPSQGFSVPVVWMIRASFWFRHFDSSRTPFPLGTENFSQLRFTLLSGKFQFEWIISVEFPVYLDLNLIPHLLFPILEVAAYQCRLIVILLLCAVSRKRIICRKFHAYQQKGPEYSMDAGSIRSIFWSAFLIERLSIFIAIYRSGQNNILITPSASRVEHKIIFSFARAVRSLSIRSGFLPAFKLREMVPFWTVTVWIITCRNWCHLPHLSLPLPYLRHGSLPAICINRQYISESLVLVTRSVSNGGNSSQWKIRIAISSSFAAIRIMMVIEDAAFDRYGLHFGECWLV